MWRYHPVLPEKQRIYIYIYEDMSEYKYMCVETTLWLSAELVPTSPFVSSDWLKLGEFWPIMSLFMLPSPEAACKAVAPPAGQQQELTPAKQIWIFYFLVSRGNNLFFYRTFAQMWVNVLSFTCFLPPFNCTKCKELIRDSVSELSGA